MQQAYISPTIVLIGALGELTRYVIPFVSVADPEDPTLDRENAGSIGFAL